MNICHSPTRVHYPQDTQMDMEGQRGQNSTAKKKHQMLVHFETAFPLGSSCV